MNPVLSIVIAILAVLGSLFVLSSAIQMLREKDALCRINSFGPATVLGLPLIVIAAYLHKLATIGFTVNGLIQVLVTLTALLIVSSVASNVLARSTYFSGAPISPDTVPQDLARDPD